MTDLDALYQAILRHPDDDTPRLMYADALADGGDERRGAFVRAQVGVARLPPDDPAAVRYEHHDRRRLFDPRWLFEADLPDGLSWHAEAFRRGFPAAVHAKDGAAFLAHADEVFGRYPVEVVAFTGVRASEADPLAASPWLGRVTRLEFPGGVTGPVTRRLFDSPHLGRLTGLHVGSEMTAGSTAENLIRSRAFGRLTALSWRSDTRRPGPVVGVLTRLADPPPLRALNLAGNRVTADRAARLLAAPVMAAVEDLDLSDNPLGPDGARALAGARLPHLRGLTLIRTRPGPEGVHALGSPGLAGLRSLSLAGNHLGPAAAHHLANAPALGDLRVLGLADNTLGDAGAYLLANAPHLGNLLHLDLAGNGIDDDGARMLADSPHLGGLVCLDLGSNLISEPAADRLRDRFGDRVFV